MADTLQYLADRMALADVMTTYAKAVDERDPALYRSLFTDDAEVVGFGSEVFRGADAWLAYWRKALEQYGPTHHMLGPQLATIDGHRARCRTDVQALHFLKDKPKTTLTSWATYVTDMVRVGGAWKIARHEIVSRGSRAQSD
jgi:uncharacterized protein (TIGR02246 family)